MKNKPVFLILIFIFSVFALPACGGDAYYDGYEDEYAEDEYEAETSDTVSENNPAYEAVENAFSQNISNFINEIMEKEGLPGAAVAVVQGNKIIFTEGFGYRDVDAGLPVTRDTLFHIGSTNKSLTAMLTAILVDEGYFDWDTPVVKIYPDFKLLDARSTKTVTMRDLLSMQSGIPDSAEDDFYANNAEEIFDYVADVELIGVPGDEFSYSNISASLAGYVDVIATGYDKKDLYNGYADLLSEKVLKPIGMDSAVIRYSDAQRDPNYGKSYFGDGSEAEREDLDGDPLAPSGVVKASILDMAAYISTQLNEGIAPNGTRIVSAANLKETWKPLLENYGMGWETDSYGNYTILSHEGSFDNYLSIIGLIPDLDIGFVVLTNSEESGEGLIVDLPQYLVDELGQ